MAKYCSSFGWDGMEITELWVWVFGEEFVAAGEESSSIFWATAESMVLVRAGFSSDGWNVSLYAVPEDRDALLLLLTLGVKLTECSILSTLLRGPKKRKCGGK